jgi:hypothetical protein
MSRSQGRLAIAWSPGAIAVALRRAPGAVAHLLSACRVGLRSLARGGAVAMVARGLGGRDDAALRVLADSVAASRERLEAGVPIDDQSLAVRALAWCERAVRAVLERRDRAFVDCRATGALVARRETAALRAEGARLRRLDGWLRPPRVVVPGWLGLDRARERVGRQLALVVRELARRDDGGLLGMAEVEVPRGDDGGGRGEGLGGGGRPGLAEVPARYRLVLTSGNATFTTTVEATPVMGTYAVDELAWIGVGQAVHRLGGAGWQLVGASTEREARYAPAPTPPDPAGDSVHEAVVEAVGSFAGRPRVRLGTGLLVTFPETLPGSRSPAVGDTVIVYHDGDPTDARFWEVHAIHVLHRPDGQWSQWNCDTARRTQPLAPVGEHLAGLLLRLARRVGGTEPVGFPWLARG